MPVLPFSTRANVIGHGGFPEFLWGFSIIMMTMAELRTVMGTIDAVVPITNSGLPRKYYLDANLRPEGADLGMAGADSSSASDA
jgi:hypothetical protein